MNSDAFIALLAWLYARQRARGGSTTVRGPVQFVPRLVSHRPTPGPERGLEPGPRLPRPRPRGPLGGDQGAGPVRARQPADRARRVVGQARPDGRGTRPDAATAPPHPAAPAGGGGR